MYNFPKLLKIIITKLQITKIGTQNTCPSDNRLLLKKALPILEGEVEIYMRQK